MTTIALVHGPNLNMLGRRPSQHYGTLTLPELEAQVRAWGAERDMRVGTFQTNHEGAMLDHLRQARLDEVLEQEGLDALIVTDLVNVRYLSGYVGSNGVLVTGPRRRVLLTDSRYATDARARTRGVEVVIAGRDLMDRLAEVVGTGRVGFEAEQVSVARQGRFAARLDGVELVPTAGLVERLRVVKEPAEVDAIRTAARMRCPGASPCRPTAWWWSTWARASMATRVTAPAPLPPAACPRCWTRPTACAWKPSARRWPPAPRACTPGTSTPWHAASSRMPASA